MLWRVLRGRISAGGGGYFPSPPEFPRQYGLNEQRLAMIGPDSLIMHPGPMNRGLEISAKAADDPRATIVEQVANGVAVRMAVLYLTLTGEFLPAQEAS